MTTKDAVKLIEQSGTKVSKDRLMDALRRMTSKDVACTRDAATGYSLLLVKLG
jgi:hypothetical protein